MRPKKAVTKEEKLLADSTDIFSDIPDPAPKEPKKKAPKKVTEKKTVFKDDVGKSESILFFDHLL